MNKKTIRLFENLRRLGFTLEESYALKRIERALHKWGEMECGDNGQCIERDEKEVPYLVNYNLRKPIKYRIPDREKSALKRLAKIMESHPEFTHYHQTDPRGCALYIIKKSELVGQDIECVYNRGLAIC